MGKKSFLGHLFVFAVNGGMAWGLPQDPQVVHGQAQISNQSQAVMQILQSTPQAIIHWNSFNIGPGEVVRFLQPGQNSSVLNRVTGLDPSVILGLLQGNGRVFLLNPNGILFGAGSVVDVGSFMASTLQMSDSDFLSGQYHLKSSESVPLAALVHQGSIRVAEGGFVVLVSPLLESSGSILAQSGHVQLGATREATFSVDGQSLVHFVVPDGFDPHFTGGGQGGTVLLQPGQMSEMLAQVIHNPGIVEAGQLEAVRDGWQAHGSEGLLLQSGVISVDGAPGSKAGSIRLDSSGATVLAPGSQLSANADQADAGQVLALSAGPTLGLGSIEAASLGGEGGFVEVSGRLLSLHGPVNVSGHDGRHGQVLLDPGNLTIVDAGPGSLDLSLPEILAGTGGPSNHSVSTAAIAAISGAVTLEATNDITYNTTTGFSAPNTDLTVSAGNNIVFHSTGSLTLTTRSLNLEAGRDLSLSSANQVSLTANTGNLSLSGGGNVSVTAPIHLTLSSPTAVTVSAGNDTLVSSGAGGAILTLNGPNTTFSAGQDLTVRSNGIAQTVTGNVTLVGGRDLNLVSHPGSSLTGTVGALNATAGRDLAVNSASILALTASQGDMRLAGARNTTVTSASTTNLASSQGGLQIQGQDVRLDAAGTQTLSGDVSVNVAATNGSLDLRSGSSGTVQSASGPVNLNATQNTSVNASIHLTLDSPISTTVSAGNDTFVSSGFGGAVLTLNGPNTTLSAGQDLTVRSNGIAQTVTGNVTLVGGRDLNLVSHPGSSLTGTVGALNATAGRDLTVTAGSILNLVASQGDLRLAGARNTTVTSASTTNLASSQGGLQIQGQNVRLDAEGTQTLSGSMSVNLAATNGSLDLRSGSSGTVQSASGPVNLNATQNTSVNAGIHLTLDSPISTTVSAGNDTFVSSGVGGAVLTLNGPNTTLSAGQDLTVRSNQLDQLAAGNVNLVGGRDLNLVSHPGSSLTGTVGALNATAGRDLTVTAGSILNLVASQGDMRLAGARNTTVTSASTTNLASSQGGLQIQGQDVRLDAAGTQTLSGNTSVNVAATNGSLDLRSGSSGTVQSASGPVNLNATQNTSVNASIHLTLDSPISTTVSAGNDTFVSSGVGGAILTLNGPNTTLSAGQDLTVRSNHVAQSAAGNVSLNSGRDLTIRSHPGAALSANVQQLSATAGRDLNTEASGTLSLTASLGASLGAGRDLRMQNGSTTLNSAAGNVALQAGNELDLSNSGSFQINSVGAVLATNDTADFRPGSQVNTGAGGIVVQSAESLNTTLLALNSSSNVTALAGSNLVVGNISAPNVQLQGSNITLHSFQNLGGANYTIQASQDLRETVPTVVAPTLTNLNITAGSIFGNGNNSSLSVPNASESLVVTVTGGNLTAFEAAASLSQFNGANISLQTTPQTGDIYVDGVLVFQGSPPPDPPPLPDPPPGPSVPQSAAAPEQGLTEVELGELRSAVAQSNIMLGNGGGSSRILEAREWDRLTSRNDFLKHTFLVDPFSPTMTLVMGSPLDWLRSGEIGSFLATFNEELRDKDSPAFNAMVDQEVREIWEVRYWRHLLEGFVIWEDAE